jgi:hypothetical protein
LQHMTDKLISHRCMDKRRGQKRKREKNCKKYPHLP